MPSWAPLTEEQLQARRLVGINAETVTSTSSNDIPHHYGPEQDESWDLDHFRRGLKIKFHQNQPYDSAFSVIGVDASIANAYRRILLSEVPTLAIEDVFIFNNTSIIQDEVLAHRLGLIPLTGSDEGLRWLSEYRKPPPKDDFAAQAAYEEEGISENDQPQASNTVILELNVECRWATKEKDGRDGRALAKQGITDPEQRYVNSNVYARDLSFHPAGQQSQYFSGEGSIRSTNPDILVAKLRPGQVIHLRCHCYKGIGSDHAKFSPVATASYRLLPDIKIISPILGADAKKFARCFPRGVIALVDDSETGEKKAVVKDPFKDTVSRECLRHDEFKNKVKLGRVRDHFIYSVESTGQYESDALFLDAVKLLKAKAQKFTKHLDDLEDGR